MDSFPQHQKPTSYGNKKVMLKILSPYHALPPLPDPATPTVAAPAPMNLAAESISLVTAEVWKLRTAGSWGKKKKSFTTRTCTCQY